MRSQQNYVLAFCKQMQLKLGLIIIKLLRHAMCPFPENYVPPKVINKLTLMSQQKKNEMESNDWLKVWFGGW